MKTTSCFTLALLLAAATIYTGCGPKTDSAGGAIPESPDGAIKYIATELSKGDGGVLWQAMPASYQQDVNSIARLAGTKIDAEIYDRVFATLARAASVLDKQQGFIFESSLTPGAGVSKEEGSAQVRQAWPSIKKIVDTLTSSPLATAAGLQNFDGATFFKGTVSNLLTDIDALTKLDPEHQESFLNSLSQVSVNYVEGTENEVVLQLAVPGEEVEAETFVKVEDRWVPQDMATEWATQLMETRSKLEAIDPAKMAEQKSQILNVFTMIDGVLTQIEAAETQAQFDQALQGAMMPLMGLMMMGQGLGGGDAAPAMPVMPEQPDAPAEQ